jgi:hypothetical protein
VDAATAARLSLSFSPSLSLCWELWHLPIKPPLGVRRRIKPAAGERLRAMGLQRRRTEHGEIGVGVMDAGLGECRYAGLGEFLPREER